VLWSLRGDPALLVLAPPAVAPARRDGLWRDTCFELFLGVPGDPGYRELNLAPSGDWNAYRFDACRTGARPEPTLRALPFAVTRAEKGIALELRLDLGPLGWAQADLEAAVAAVLRSPAGSISHWALHHAGSAPDFHDRAGFRLALPASP